MSEKAVQGHKGQEWSQASLHGPQGANGGCICQVTRLLVVGASDSRELSLVSDKNGVISLF